MNRVKPQNEMHPKASDMPIVDHLTFSFHRFQLSVLRLNVLIVLFLAARLWNASFSFRATQRNFFTQIVIG